MIGTKKNNVFGEVDCGEMPFMDYMTKFCGKMVTIANVNDGFYDIEEDGTENGWTDEMIEGLVEEEKPCNYINFNAKNLSFADRVELQIGDKWEIKEEYGRTYVVKKQPQYPKTYEKCCDVLNTCQNKPTVPGWKGSKIAKFQQLLICRDAYWKIAGEEMRLGKLWRAVTKDTYSIFYDRMEDEVHKEDGYTCANSILEFPTEEMRDAFYENFKELIEECKEFL